MSKPVSHPVPAGADYQPAFSTAGFFPVQDSPRRVLGLNPGWRFHKGNAEGAEAIGFDDGVWPVVNLPHGIEALPFDASGSMNYQGPAWYRKRLALPRDLRGKRVFLHFEAVMGTSRIWINGDLVSEHFGGYLPIHIDATDRLRPDGENVIAVCTDNSDDPDCPPGKPQTGLDFAYFGGIYRDVWLIATSPVYVSDPNGVDRPAGGGVFFHTTSVGEASAEAEVKVHVVNGSGEDAGVTVRTDLVDDAGKTVASGATACAIPGNGSRDAVHDLHVATPQPWHPDHPVLYDLLVTVENGDGTVLDSLSLRVGLRTVELRGPEGLYLNGKPFEEKLLGANRHQDFAYLGNALPNSLHWRDAKKLRDAGMRVVRVAHYPQDPAFMDACDELGLLVIEATPGWQFFKDGVFVERVLSDIRQMVRRDRNRPSVFAWEPILNETAYPESFAFEAARAVREEFPYGDCHLGSDCWSDGATAFPLMYGSSNETEKYFRDNRWWGPFPDDVLPAVMEHCRNATFFVREFGDNVNDWIAQDSTSRVPREWGEAAQLVQADHYDRTLKSMMSQGGQDIGGCLWHPFDHQRGYHPDPFWGGIMDAARQPKYSYGVFMAQRNRDTCIPRVESGPFVRILHEVAAVSPPDVRVVSNCDEVRLTVNGEVVGTRSTLDPDVPYYRKAVTFKGTCRFEDQKRLLREEQHDRVAIVAEGLVEGSVVCSCTVPYAGARRRIILKPDHAGAPFVADGSDMLAVVACVADEHGHTKRYGKNTLQFEVRGEGVLFGDGADPALDINPQATRWGEAVALVRSTTTPGTVTVTAREYGDSPNQLEPAELVLETVAPRLPLLYAELPERTQDAPPVGRESVDVAALKARLHAAEQELLRIRREETARNQAGHETGI